MSILIDHRLLFFLRHRPVDIAGERLYRLATPKRFFVFVFGSLSFVSVAGRAVGKVDLPAIRLPQSAPCYQECYQDKPEAG